jgi:hypothetical protein
MPGLKMTWVRGWVKDKKRKEWKRKEKRMEEERGKFFSKASLLKKLTAKGAYILA